MAYPDLRPTLTFRLQHECGQIITQSYYFTGATLGVQHEPYQPARGRLDGTIETIELGGIQFSNMEMKCARCEKSVVFPDPAELVNGEYI